MIPAFGEYSKYGDNKCAEEMRQQHQKLWMESCSEKLMTKNKPTNTERVAGDVAGAAGNSKKVDQGKREREKVIPERVPKVDDKGLCINIGSKGKCDWKKCPFNHDWKMTKEEVEYAYGRTNSKPAEPTTRARGT